MSKQPNSATAGTKSAWLKASGPGSGSASAGKSSAMASKSTGWSTAKTTSASVAKSAWSAPTYADRSDSAAKSSWSAPSYASGSGVASGSSAAKSSWSAPSYSAGSGSSTAGKYSSSSGLASSSSSPWGKSSALVPKSSPVSSSMISSSSAAYGTRPTTSSVGLKSSSTGSTTSTWSSSKISQQTSTSTSSTQVKSSVFGANKSTSSISKTYSAKEQFYAQQQQHHASSINKNVIDKATNLALYKSPDLLAARHGTGILGGRGLIGSVAGTKYYQPVYSRTLPDQSAAASGAGMIGGGLMRAAPTTVLAAAVLNQQAANSETVGSGRQQIANPIGLVTKTPTASIGVAVAKSTEANEMTNQQQQQQQQQRQPVAVEPAKPSGVAKPLAHLHAKPGYLIIFNQQDFRMPGVQRRAGSQKDEEALCRTFYEFGFDPHVKRNLRLKELDKVARDLHSKDFKKYACCVVVILSHGHQNETIYAADGSFKLQSMLVDRIAQNSTLQGKAKIFIVAACKGDSEDVMAPPMAARMQTDATQIGGQAKQQLPYMRDTLKCYSTYEGFVSYRDPERGTVFVQELCQVLRQHGRRQHVEDCLKLVNVALTERAHNQQVPSVVSTMSFNICLGDLKH